MTTPYWKNLRRDNEYEPMEMELKIMPEYFEAVRTERKTFELRKNDRGYMIGDTLILKEWDGEKYTGREIKRIVKYILKDCEKYGLKDGYCILGFNKSNYYQHLIAEKIEDIEDQNKDQGETAWQIARYIITGLRMASEMISMRQEMAE